MTTVKAFNEMMRQFIEDVTAVFPDELALYIAMKKPCEYQDFIKQVSPWSSHIMSKNPEFFCEENEFAKSLYLHQHWYEVDCTDQTKEAIWQWISSLYMIAMTLNMFPPEALAQIEMVAESCAKNMKEGADETSMLSGMNAMLSSMMSGAGPLAGLMNAQPPKKKKSNKKSR